MKNRSRLIAVAVCVAFLGLLTAGPASSSHPTFPWGGVVTGPGESGGPHVREFDHDGNPRSSLFAYQDGFYGGVRVAVGDFGADDYGDFVTGAGPGGGPHVRVFDGVSLVPITGFFAFNPAFGGGVFVATGVCEGTSFIAVGAGEGGGPHVNVFTVTGGVATSVGNFFAYAGGFSGGVRVGTADIDGNNCDDIITGAGPGAGSHVRVFSGDDLTGTPDFTPMASFFAYRNDSTGVDFSGGVYVAGGDLDCNSDVDIVTGPGSGTEPRVKAFISDGSGTMTPDGSFLAYAANFTGGVRVAVHQLTGDCEEEIITGAGPGGGPHVRTFSSAPIGVPLQGWFAYAGGFGGGVYVSGVTQTVDATP